jgi:MFS family permease
VLKAIRDPNIWRVYWTILLLGTAYGLGVAVIALHLDALGYHERAIGGLAAWFALGIVLLSIPAGRLVGRWGAKRTLVFALAGYAASVSIFPLLTSYAPIAAARFVDGACSACLWVSCETILLRRSDRTNKAQVMSVYAMAMAIGYLLGPIAANLIAARLPLKAAFVASGIIAATSAAYVALRLEPDAVDVARAGARQAGEAASEDAGAKTKTLAILGRIKTSCFATFAYGYFEASVVLFLPLYLMHDKGILRDQTIAIPAFFAAGMLLFTNVAGRLGDRFGHLFLMKILASIGCATVLAFVALDSFVPMAIAVFVAGATIASISPVSLALQGVVTERRDYDRANSIYNAFYAAGILLGPPISGLVFARWGGATMLFHLAAMWGAFVAFAAAFAADDPASGRAPSRSPRAAVESPSSPSLDA